MVVRDAAMMNVAGGGEGFFGLGADAEVGVGFGEDDLPVFAMT